MTQLQTNVKAIENAVVNLNVQSREGRNDVLRAYHKRLTPAVQRSLVYTHGSQVYRDKTLETFLDLINKRPIHMPIRFTGGDDNQLLANAANEASNLVYARALRIRDTGAHLMSLTTFAREVGIQNHYLVPGRVRADQLPERAIVSVVAVIDYASTLEVRGMAQGILYYAAKQLRSRYGSQLAVKFDYISGRKLGYKGGTFPRIQIGHYGNLRSRLQTPGKTARRRRRR